MIPVLSTLLPPAELLRGLSDSATGSLLAAIWQGALLAGAAALGLRLLPKTPAAARFAIWFAVFLVVAGLPLLTLIHQPAAASVPSSHQPWLTLNSHWSEAILALWAAASLTRGVTLVFAVFRVRALSRSAKPLPESQRASRSLGRSVPVCTSDQVDRPSVIGFFSPKILIPTWLVEKLSPKEMAHVILHEAGHLRRADDWLNLLQKLALVIFPLNPALVWIERRLCFERELACDDRVLQATGAPKAYASCLASLAEHRMTRRGAALVMAALGRESELGQRVLRILSRRDPMRPAHARLVMGTAIAALVAGTTALERGPQLIGFSPSSAAPQQALAHTNRAAQTSAALPYQPVVFHPAAPAATSSPGIGQGSAATDRPIPPVRTTAVRAVAAASHRGATTSPAASSGWLVMTSTSTWSADGAHVVMTSIRRSASLPVLQSDFAPSAPARSDAAPSQVPDFYPYAAAVPVRGGWLIIQL